MTTPETVAAVVGILVLVLSIPLVFMPWVRSWRHWDQAVRAEVEITATHRAAEYVQQRGSLVFVWTESGSLLRATIDRPQNLEFEHLDGPGFAVFIERGLNLGSWIRIERDPFPPWRLIVVLANMPTSP